MLGFKRKRLSILTLALLVSIPFSEALSQETDAPTPGVSQRVTNLSKALQRSLPNKIQTRVASLGQNAKIGVAIADARTGYLLFEHNADQGFAIASNAKIITAAAALSLLGPEFQFKTELLAEPISRNGHITGDLYIRGRGNAAFSEADMTQLVRRLKARGVVRIDGGVVVDNSYFDTHNLPPHFDEQPDEHASFRAPIAATSYAYNAWTLFVRPALNGTGPARTEVLPANDYVRILSSIKTVATGRSHIKMETKVESSRLVVTLSGQIRQEARHRRFRKRVPNPVYFVGSGLKRALANAGIGVRRASIKSGKAPASALTLATHDGPSLAVMIRGMGKYSNNFVAEMMLKVIGAETHAHGQPATWQHGVQAVQDVLGKAGLARNSYRYENGSGLFDSNRFSPNQMIQILQSSVSDFRVGPDLVASLSIAGTDGTLRRRLSESPATQRVRAKTGTLDEASALSGVAAIHGGSQLLFSILINGFPESSIGIARALQDEIAAELIRSLAP